MEQESMIVVCNNGSCQYLSGNGFCRRRVVSIINGRCEYLTMKELRKEEPVYFDGYVKSKMEQEREEAVEKLAGILSIVAKQKEDK